jgi:hypothetical protein
MVKFGRQPERGQSGAIAAQKMAPQLSQGEGSARGGSGSDGDRVRLSAPAVPAIAEDFPLGNEPYRVGLRRYHDGTPENALNRLLTSILGG